MFRNLLRISPFRFPSAGGQEIPANVRASMGYAVGEGALSGVMVVFLSSVLLTGLALSLGANDFLIGLLAAIQAGANLLQMQAYRVLEKRGNRKSMAVRSALVSRLIWIPIFLLIALPENILGGTRIWFFLILFALSVGIGITSYVPWISWLVDLVPSAVRGRFFAGRTLAMGLPGIFLALLAGKFVDFWNESSLGPAPMAFLLPFGGAVVAGLLAVGMMRRMYDPPLVRPEERGTLWQSLRIPFRDGAFRKLFAFRVAFDLSAGVGGTFFGLYMLQQARLSFTFVSTLVLVSTLMQYLSLPLWGRLIDRIGNKPVLRICLIGKIGFTVLWLFTTPETYWLYVLIHLFGVFDGGNAIAIPTLVYKIAPAERRSNYISVDGTLVGIAATVAPLLGGGFAVAMVAQSFTVGSLTWSHFHLLFLVAIVLRFVALAFLDRVQEPGTPAVISRPALS